MASDNLSADICVLYRKQSGWQRRVTMRCTPLWTSSPSTTRSWAQCCKLNSTISSTGAWSRTMSSWPAPGPTVWRTWSSLMEPSTLRLSGIRLAPACWIYLGLQSQLSKLFWLLCKGKLVSEFDTCTWLIVYTTSCTCLCTLLKIM